MSGKEPFHPLIGDWLLVLIPVSHCLFQSSQRDFSESLPVWSQPFSHLKIYGKSRWEHWFYLGERKNIDHF